MFAENMNHQNKVDRSSGNQGNQNPFWRYLSFDCFQLVSTEGHRQKKKFGEEIFQKIFIRFYMLLEER